jgi:hypothetical protein
VETSAVLPRLPGDLPVQPADAARLLDAPVGLAAVEHEVSLATRDARAKDTYDELGVQTIVAA